MHLPMLHINYYIDILRIIAYAMSGPLWLGAAFIWWNNGQRYSAIFGFASALSSFLLLIIVALGEGMTSTGALELSYTVTILVVPSMFILFFREQSSIHKNSTKIDFMNDPELSK